MIIILGTYLYLSKKAKSDSSKQPGEPQNSSDDLKENPASKKKKKNSNDISLQKQPQQAEEAKSSQAEPKNEKKYSEQIKDKSKKQPHLDINHPLFLTQLKGFCQPLTDFSFSSQYIAVGSRDKTFKVFDLVQTIKEKTPKYFYYQNQYNNVTAIAISEDCNFVAQALSQDLTIQILQFFPNATDVKKYFAVYQTFPSKIHQEEIVKVGFSKNNQFVISVASNQDINVKIWSMKGQLIKQLNTSCVQHNDAAITSKFIAVANWTSVVKVLETKLEKDGAFNSLEKVMNLSHQTQVNTVTVAQNEKIAGTVTKDGTITFWNLDVRYQANEDAKVILAIKPEQYAKYFKQEKLPAVSACAAYHEIKKKWIFAICNTQEIAIMDEAGTLLEGLQDVVSKNCEINRILFMNIKDNIVLLNFSKADLRVSVFKMNKFFG